MDFEEFRQRLEATRARAALRRLQAVEVLANNEDLRRENAEAFSRTNAHGRGRDGEIRRQPDGVPPTDPEQHHP